MRPPAGDPLLEDVHDWLDELSPFGSAADPLEDAATLIEAARVDRDARTFDGLT